MKAYKELIIANLLLIGVLLLVGTMVKPASHYKAGAELIVNSYMSN